MSKEAADWLTSLKPDVIGFDFPQDYDIRKLRFGVDERHCYLTTHRHCLKYDIMMIEYMHNMREVKDKFVEFVGLPTALLLMYLFLFIPQTSGHHRKASAILPYQPAFPDCR